MVAYIALGFVFLLFVLWGIKWAAAQPPAVVAEALRSLVRALLVVPLVVVQFLLFHPVIALILSLLFIVGFIVMNRQRAYSTPPSGATPFSSPQVSSVKTDILKMRLFHDTGRMEGEVLSGSYAGQVLDDLSLPQLQELWSFCKAEDPASQALLENYLDRERGAGWRASFGPEAEGMQEPGEGKANGGKSGEGTANGGDMTVEEAYAILGLEAGCSKEDIQAAYRRLMLHAHPDHGGSDYLASKINLARKYLIERLS